METIQPTHAEECFLYILDHECEDYYQQAYEQGITQANWETKWDGINHIYVAALKAMNMIPRSINFIK